ncbi:hypothetical protein [Sediminicurvatus halobius]|uniref:Uncharacterized protein n=1 Tax=Sediminicurvatus halobius TaxID=2182432 RepID=A0A2U2N7I1_9GAMM|nr:hypothetical protein [Spiribacter halobius]PWG65145.1 hypothetical protein DEM34_02380 [Spiribacter halobius]UEX78905.1 hypothetical protein LMH63_04480 [Spiribacter halobius]
MHWRLLFTLVLVATAGLWAASPALAAEPPTAPRPTLPDDYPREFDRIGFVNGSELRSGRINVGADWYALDTNVRVHTPATRHASIHALRAGVPVGLTVRRDREGQPVVVAIWVLPENYIEPS